MISLHIDRQDAIAGSEPNLLDHVPDGLTRLGIAAVLCQGIAELGNLRSPTVGHVRVQKRRLCLANIASGQIVDAGAMAGHSMRDA